MPIKYILLQAHKYRSYEIFPNDFDFTGWMFNANTGKC